jgi:hypothetical protein
LPSQKPDEARRCFFTTDFCCTTDFTTQLYR